MCAACVLNSVKDRMPSRRDLFRSATARAAATAIYDASVKTMIRELSEDVPTYFGAPGIAMDQQFTFIESGGNLFETTVNEHTAALIDTPLDMM